MFNKDCRCGRQNEVNQNFTADNMNVDVDIDFNNQMPMGGVNMMNGNMMGSMASPIMEPVQERQIHRTIMHNVPQV